MITILLEQLSNGTIISLAQELGYKRKEMPTPRFSKYLQEIRENDDIEVFNKFQEDQDRLNEEYINEFDEYMEDIKEWLEEHYN